VSDYIQRLSLSSTGTGGSLADIMLHASINQIPVDVGAKAER